MAYRSRIFSSILLAAAALSPVSSLAADVDDIVYADDANFVKPAELGSGWYLRGDIGLNINGTQNTNSSGNPARTVLFDNNITNGYNFSIGGGKRINGFLRLEANIGRLAGTDYSQSQLMTEAPGNTDPTDLLVGETEPIACNGTGEFIDIPTGTTFLGPDYIENCLNIDNVEYDTTFAMVNAYVDLPKMYGFQPFIGGGLGVGRVSWRQEIDRIECTPVDEDLRLEGCSAFGVADQPAPNTPYTQPGTISEGVGYRLGYQLAAGFGYDVSDNLTLDTTYKYTRYGDGKFNDVDGATLAAEGFSVHQVNVGLRYSFF